MSCLINGGFESVVGTACRWGEQTGRHLLWPSNKGSEDPDEKHIFTSCLYVFFSPQTSILASFFTKSWVRLSSRSVFPSVTNTNTHCQTCFPSLSLCLLQADLLCLSNIWYHRATNCRKGLWWHLMGRSNTAVRKEIHLCTCTWTHTHTQACVAVGQLWGCFLHWTGGPWSFYSTAPENCGWGQNTLTITHGSKIQHALSLQGSTAATWQYTPRPTRSLWWECLVCNLTAVIANCDDLWRLWCLIGSVVTWVHDVVWRY